MSKKIDISAEHKLDDLTSVSQTVLPLAKQLLGTRGFVQIDLLENWESIVGPSLAKYCLPQKITFNKNQRENGTVFVMVFGGAFAMEIEGRKLQILQKINTFFGYSAVSNLKIVQNNSPDNFLIKQNADDKPKKILVSDSEQNYITELIKDIDSPDLKKRLENIGKHILSDKHKI